MYIPVSDFEITADEYRPYPYSVDVELFSTTGEAITGLLSSSLTALVDVLSSGVTVTPVAPT